MKRFVGGFGEAQSGAPGKAVIARNHEAQALDLQLVPSKPGSEDPDAAIDCRNRPPTRYQGAAEIVASPDLACQGANRCKFVTWISAQRCFEQTRALGAHRVVRRSGPHLPRIQQEARKVVDSALKASTEASNRRRRPMADPKVLGIVLAGGEGKRLSPLTLDRAKPAVPFGGLYRLIDFALSNLVNAGVLRIAVLTQYKSHSLDRHITTTWRMSSLLANYVTPVPAQQRLGPQWYTGSADAIYQSLNLIHDEKPDLVIVFGADHVYRMDPRQMIAQHLASGAGATVAGIPVPRKEASAFGVIKTASDGLQVEAFLEKPPDPPGLPGRPDETFASMGNYLFSADVLVEALRKDAADESSKHDMGGNIMPMMVDQGKAQVYDFQRNEVPGAGPADAGYWRDVGTLDSYYDAHMDLCAVVPVFNLYNSQWPILTHIPPHPPAKFVHEDGDRVGHAVNSVVSNGVIVSGALVRESVLSPGARIEDYAIVERSVIMNNTVIGANAVVQNAIIDKDVVVPEGAQVGVDKDHDRERGFVVSDSGVTVVGKSQEVTK
jgi:glucose-1-phosphate adenylyltransferase